MDTLTIALVSARILALVSQGMKPQEAFDAVLGQGTYQRLAEELYDHFRAQP